MHHASAPHGQEADPTSCADAARTTRPGWWRRLARMVLHLLTSVAGKNDPDVLHNRRIPRSALHAEATVGMAVVVTSIFAAVASTASMLMVLDDHPWRWLMAPAFGLVWATAIFCIDRALVISMDGTRHWGPMTVRLVLGVVIAVSVSLPIDIAVFQERVQTQLRAQRIAERLKGQEDARKVSGYAQAQEATGQARERLQQAQAAAMEWPPVVRQAMAEEQACGRELEATRARVARQLDHVAAQASGVGRELALLAQRGKAGDAAAARVATLQAEWTRLQRARTTLAGELPPVARRCELAAQGARTAQQAYRAEAEQNTAAARQALERTEQQEDTAQRQMEEINADAENVARTSLSRGFAAKAEALHRLVSEDPYVRWVYLTILIVWLTLEMAPVIARGMTGRTAVDAVLQSKFQRIELELQAERAEAESRLLRGIAIDDALQHNSPEQVARHPEVVAEIVNAELQSRAAMATPMQLRKEFEEFVSVLRQQRSDLRDLPPSWSRDAGMALDALMRSAAQRVTQTGRAWAGSQPRTEQAPGS